MTKPVHNFGLYSSWTPSRQGVITRRRWKNYQNFWIHRPLLSLNI